MRAFARQQYQPKQRVSSSLTRPNTAQREPNHQANPILHLQRTIGNHAVQRMLQNVQRLEVGSDATAFHRLEDGVSQIPIHSPALRATQKQLAIHQSGDVYEQEAGRSPEELMRMSEPRLQRACACGNHTTASGECSECSKRNRSGLQTQLEVSEPGDIYEREADRIADQVMTTPAHHAVSGASSHIRRLAGQPIGQAHVAPHSVHQTLASPGRPLEPALRQDMEQRFGHDFSRVRLHADPLAAESARAVDALAYTVGDHIVFGQGRYSPGSAEGRRLLAHELAHVTQHPGHSLAAPAALEISDHPHLEEEAKSMASAITRSEPSHLTRPHQSGAGLHRQKGAAPKKPTPADIIEEARAAAYLRVQIANQRIQGVGPAGPTDPDLAAHERQLEARRLAQVLFNWADPNMRQVEEIVGKMLTALAPGSSVKQAAASDPNCAGLVPAYVIGNKPPIVLCPRWFSMSPEDRIRNMVHEAAHVAGIGQPKSEGYCVAFTCEAVCGSGFTAADAWSQYVHCLSGRPADVSTVPTKPSAKSPKPASGGKP